MIQITEEPSKLDVLQSRVDQQVELICILKRRADEYLQKYMASEEQLKSLEKGMETKQLMCEAEHKQCILLKQNVDQLEKINKDLLQSKQDDKEEKKNLDTKCNELTKNVERLIEECKLLKAEPLKSDDNKSVDCENLELQKKLDDREEQLKLLYSENRNYTVKMEKEVQTLNSELSSTKKQLKEVTTSLKTIQKDFAIKVNEGTDFEKQISTLQSEVESSKVQLEGLKKKFDQEQKQHASEKEKMKREYLQKERSLPAYALEEERKLMTKDLNAYKEHADQLLNKEKEINAKLRRLTLKSAGRTPKPPDAPRKQNTK